MRNAVLRELRSRGIIDDDTLNTFVSAETYRAQMND